MHSAPKPSVGQAPLYYTHSVDVNSTSSLRARSDLRVRASAQKRLRASASTSYTLCARSAA
jgi:hypothetical protein